MAFPTNLTNAADNVTDVLAAHINNLEAKVGIDGSAVTTSHDYKLSTITSSAKAVSTTGAQSIDGLKTFGDGIATDTIAEETAAAGVTIDGVKLKDSQVYTDTIVEKTSAAGVTADGVLLKDSQVSTDTINELSAGVGVTVDSVNLKDGKVAATALMTTAWADFTPAFTGSGGSAGTYAITNSASRWCTIGKVVHFIIAVSITNKGSWSGDVRLNYPVTASTNLVQDRTIYPQVVLIPNAGHPLTSARAVAAHGGADTYMIFNSGYASTNLQWSSVSNTDWVIGQGSFEID